jgi:peptidoglycan/xylan/chitin deacetylase (PgdA/CDA1 family)
MLDLTNYQLDEVKKYVDKYDLLLEIKEEYSNKVKAGYVINQSIKSNTKIVKGSKLIVVISLGENYIETYQKYQVNELGKVPIMMYHGIVNLKNEETFSIGGNVDQDGYNRTIEAFKNDLEMYYQKGYRMIRLKDYIDGNINVELGKSPIILTFDDGNQNNIKVLDKENGNLIIDPNSAVGILESYKKKYSDFNITATFFLNEGLFEQPLYNEDIIKWLINNGYDIGNHTKGHINFSNVTKEEAQSSIAYMYKRFDEIIPNQYVNIISLPFGSPFTKEHEIFSYILQGKYDNYNYQTEATLRVGWEPEYSPFHHNFDKTFLKRVRAWDNNGQDFDLTMCFNMLEDNKFISDGKIDTIVIPNSLENNLNTLSKTKKVIKY